VQLTIENSDQPVVFLDPQNYEIDGAGFNAIAGVALLALFAASLWFSWIMPGLQIKSISSSGGAKRTVSEISCSQTMLR